MYVPADYEASGANIADGTVPADTRVPDVRFAPHPTTASRLPDDRRENLGGPIPAPFPAYVPFT